MLPKRGWIDPRLGEVDLGVHQATSLSSVAALALVAWDAVLTFGDEVDHIWPKSGRTHVKWIYLFSKWFGLLVQICQQIWLRFLTAQSPVPPSTCQYLFIYGGTTFQLLQFCLDTVLILRIWAVHQQNRYYIAIAFTVVVIQTALMIMTLVFSVPKFAVDGICMILDTPPTITLMGIGVILSQSVIIFLTYRGKARMAPAARQSKIIFVVLRDGTLVFCAMICIMLICTLYFLLNRMDVNVLLPWMPIIPSVFTPRIILNMQKAIEPADSMLELSTVDFDAWENDDGGDEEEVRLRVTSACGTETVVGVYDEYTNSSSSRAHTTSDDASTKRVEGYIPE